MDSPAATFASFEVKGAAQDASPSLIFGGSFSSSISAILSVSELRSNAGCTEGRTSQRSEQTYSRPETYPLSRVCSLSLLHRSQRSLLSLDKFRVDGLKGRGDDRRWCTESCRQLALLLVDFLESFVPLVFGNLLQVLLSSVQQRDTDMCLLERADVVGAVSSHQSGVAQGLHSLQDVLLLWWRNPSVDPGVLDQVDKSGLALVLLHRRTGHTDVVIAQD